MGKKNGLKERQEEDPETHDIMPVESQFSSQNRRQEDEENHLQSKSLKKKSPDEGKNQVTEPNRYHKIGSGLK